MTERICEHCGQQFLSETIFDKLENLGMVLVAIYLPLHALDCFREGWHGFLPALFWLALAGSAIYELYRRGKKKEREVVKWGRACPSCGERTAHVDSPLGEQLIDYWSSPQKVDEHQIEAEQSITAREADQKSSVPTDV
jgi:hypothetical protein